MSSNEKLKLINQTLSPRIFANNMKIKFRKTVKFDYKYKLPNNPYKLNEKHVLASSPMSLITKNEMKRL